MELCERCGRVAPGELEACQACGAKFGRRTGSTYDPELSWAAVRCQFQCRSCGHLSPLDHLDVDGSVSCRRCGLEQAYAVDSWRQALGHAHAVADLAGPDPEGRRPHPRLSIAADNPFKQVGVSATEAGHQQSGQADAGGVSVPNTLRVFAAPGQPLCSSCHEPLSLDVKGPGTIELGCGGCNTRPRYELPQRALELHQALVGVIDGEHRSDAAAVSVEAPEGEQGAIAIKCPSCGAPLEIKDTGQIVTCGFCQTPARIPSSTYGRLVNPKLDPATWWLLFRGPSALRRALERSPEGAGRGGYKVATRSYELPEVVAPPLPVTLALAIGLPLVLLTIAFFLF